MKKIPPDFLAFTLKSNGRIRDIISDCNIMLPVPPQERNKGPEYRTKALWDTGATNCAITPETVKQMGLKPITQTLVNHADGSSRANVYLINVVLPNRVVIPFVKATECSGSAGRFGIIIGMDVITLGDFSITNVSNKTTVSFRIPSKKTIDYVSEFKEEQFKKHTPIVVEKHVERNDPCPCGSGQKFKNCCGKPS